MYKQTTYKVKKIKSLPWKSTGLAVCVTMYVWNRHSSFFSLKPTTKETEGTLPSSFHEATVSLIPEPHKNPR